MLVPNCTIEQSVNTPKKKANNINHLGWQFNALDALIEHTSPIHTIKASNPSATQRCTQSVTEAANTSSDKHSPASR